uniref:Uncharacterized protein n=1 Tax=uncultured organism MedDCM-OCT-S08-C288 TaxID=743637 RepID=D6PJ91_9ZZZZ|nr:hypothetical protein [uncultured organism MedDCM-OCT-S08-C288]
MPVVDHFQTKGLVRQIDAAVSPDAVWQGVEAIFVDERFDCAPPVMHRRDVEWKSRELLASLTPLEQVDLCEAAIREDVITLIHFNDVYNIEAADTDPVGGPRALLGALLGA